MAVRETLKLLKPKKFMKNVPTFRVTVTCSLLSNPATGEVVMLTPSGPDAVHVAEHATLLVTVKPFLRASAIARSVASLPEPEGIACDCVNWPGMNTTPDSAPS